MIVWDWRSDEFGDAEELSDSSSTGWQLVAPAPHHAPTVASWCESAAEAAVWVSMALDPFPPHIVAGWWEVPYSTPWVLADEDGIAVGYGEIWDDEDEDEIELARIIVDPERRRQGVGRRLVAALLTEGRRYGRSSCFLRVTPHNVAARRLYLASGFIEVSPAEAASWNVDQPVDYVWMTHEAFGLAPGDGVVSRPGGSA